MQLDRQNRIILTQCLVLLCSPSLSYCLSARNGTEDGSEEWGYIPVRPGASMFYWFYRTTHPDGYLNRPIVLWLQGGPGLSGTGLGNFLMFGPLDQNLEPRNATWLKTTNLLFVDNPVHSGFSIAEKGSEIPDTIEKISEDLITVLKTFMNEHSYLQTNPLYIFGQSYGGKMAPALAYYLNEEIKSGAIQCNLKGIGIGNGFVSPIDFILQFSPLLYQMALVDHEQHQKLNDLTLRISKKMEMNEWNSAHDILLDLWDSLGRFVPQMSNYNFMDFSKIGSNIGTIYDIAIADVMNGPIRKKLGIIPQDKSWGENRHKVYHVQNDSGDVLKPVLHLVDDLLKNSGLDIVVYQGQLDLICNTAGALGWIQKLTWPGLEKYNATERKTLTDPVTKIPEMFVKSYKNLKMYWVLNAGHVVPADVPDVALRMLNRVIDGTD